MTKHKILALIAATIVSTILISCSSGKETSKDKHEKHKTVITAYLNDSSELTPYGEKNLENASATGSLSRPGDYVEFPKDVPVEFTLVDLDPTKYDLEYSFDSETNLARIQVVEKNYENRIVVLDKKCQIKYIPPGKIPQVMVNEELPEQQVVITPRYNQPDCEFIGFEIRYGSIEQGCTKGKVVLNALNNCRGKTKPAVTVEKGEKGPKNWDKYWKNFLFGK